MLIVVCPSTSRKRSMILAMEPKPKYGHVVEVYGSTLGQ